MTPAWTPRLDARRYVFYARAGLLSIVSDRALVFTDLCLGTLIPYLIQFLIWSSVYGSGIDQIEGYSYTQTVFYYAFALAFGRLNNGYDVIESFSSLIQEGRLEAYLAKPVLYPVQRMFQFLGESIVYLVPLAVILLAYAVLAPGPWGAASLGNGCMAVVLIAISQLLCFQIALLISTLAFWVVRSDVLLSFMISVTSLLGGTLLPPEFWPEWLLPLMKYNPFRYVIAAPAEFIVRPSTAFFLECLAVSGLYLGVCLLAVRRLWSRGLQQYGGAGG